MKKASKKTGRVKDAMRNEYDFSAGVRGKYAKDFLDSPNLVLLDPDVAELFPTSDAVNDALRALARIAKATRSKRKTASKKRTTKRKS